jgi:hypothetical protein
MARDRRENRPIVPTPRKWDGGTEGLTGRDGVWDDDGTGAMKARSCCISLWDAPRDARGNITECAPMLRGTDVGRCLRCRLHRSARWE